MRLLLGFTLLFWSAALFAQAGAPPRLDVHADPASGLTGWHWQSGGLSVELVQLLPDQVRAFFRGRGFGPDEADAIATSCVFQSIMRNTSGDAEVELDLGRWRTLGSHGSGGLRLNRQWQQRWEARAIPASARIAFRWALFPTEQQFRAGDWLMGMIAFDLPPGTEFDLELHWDEGGRDVSAIMPKLQCAPDVRTLLEDGS